MEAFTFLKEAITIVLVTVVLVTGGTLLIILEGILLLLLAIQRCSAFLNAQMHRHRPHHKLVSLRVVHSTG